MGRFTLRIPKTLHNELDVLAKSEGISLNQYIIYTLTQKVTTEKVAVQERKLTSEQAAFLANVKFVPSEQIADQKAAFEALLTSLGAEATDEEVEQYLSERESVEPEPGLEAEAVIRLKERIAQVKQAA
ncbi:MAG: hypothetical protein Kow0031_10600 [Anaerolineae bacterium]